MSAIGGGDDDAARRPRWAANRLNPTQDGGAGRKATADLFIEYGDPAIRNELRSDPRPVADRAGPAPQRRYSTT